MHCLMAGAGSDKYRPEYGEASTVYPGSDAPTATAAVPSPTPCPVRVRGISGNAILI